MHSCENVNLSSHCKIKQVNLRITYVCKLLKQIHPCLQFSTKLRSLSAGCVIGLSLNYTVHETSTEVFLKRREKFLE